MTGALFSDEAARGDGCAITVTLNGAELGWIIGLVRSRVKKQRNRIASVSGDRARGVANLGRMDATLELRERYTSLTREVCS